MFKCSMVVIFMLLKLNMGSKTRGIIGTFLPMKAVISSVWNFYCVFITSVFPDLLISPVYGLQWSHMNSNSALLMGFCPTCLSGISSVFEAPPGVFCSPSEEGRVVCLKTSPQPPGPQRFPSPNMLEKLMACDRGENAGSMPIVSSGYWPMC